MNYYYLYDFSEGLARFKKYIFKNKKKLIIWGFIDKDKNEIINDLFFDYVGDFHEGLARFIDPKNNVCGFIDKSGAIIISLEDCEHINDFRNELARFRTINNEWGYINKNGKITIF